MALPRPHDQQHRMLVCVASDFGAALAGLFDALRLDSAGAFPPVLVGPKLVRLAAGAATLPALVGLLDERLFSQTTSFWVTALNDCSNAAVRAGASEAIVRRQLRRLRAVLLALCEPLGLTPGPTLLDVAADDAADESALGHTVVACLRDRGFFAMVDRLHDLYDADFYRFEAVRWHQARGETECSRTKKRARPDAVVSVC